MKRETAFYRNILTRLKQSGVELLKAKESGVIKVNEKTIQKVNEFYFQREKSETDAFFELINSIVLFDIFICFSSHLFPTSVSTRSLIKCFLFSYKIFDKISTLFQLHYFSFVPSIIGQRQPIPIVPICELL